MKTIRPYLLCAGFCGMLLLSGCGADNVPGNEGHPQHHEPDGGTIVHLDRHKVFHAGIRVEEVEKRSLPVPLSLSGTVGFNERRRATVPARVGGRVETVNVFENDEAKGGQLLLEVYSPEFLAMQGELIQSARRLDRLSESSGEADIVRPLYESARRKLLLAGLSEAEVERIVSGKNPDLLLPVRAPFRGTIIHSAVRPGIYVETGALLFEIADLSTLWVMAELHEHDLPHVRTGMKAEIQAATFDRTFPGTITSISGILDERTRTAKARVEVSGSTLKPGMFCTVHVRTRLGDNTVKIPAGALLGETEDHFVFVALNDTTFEKRSIRTGVETREFAEVMDGLLEGERIVVKGAFFLKSELARETFSEDH